MSKMIAGFLLGVVVTLAAVTWLERNSVETAPEGTEQPLRPEEVTDVPRANSANEVDGVAEEGSRGTSLSRLAEPESNAEPPVSSAQPNVVPQPATGPVDATQSAARDSSATPAKDDEYPPEIADMIENSVDKELQARYENDSREDSWATYMEGQLKAYFAQQPALAQFYFSLTDCRTSVCSVHALGYGPDALTLWNSATADLVSQPWFEFNSMSMNRRNPEPDILGIVLILTKKPPG